MIQKINETAIRIADFSNEILDFSKAKVLRDKKPLALTSLIKKATLSNFPEREDAFSFTGFENEVHIYGDWHKLDQVFVNLIKNAFEAEATKIAIRIHQRDFIVLASLEDNGKGCTPEEYKKLFEAFHTTKPGGTGLGLPTSRSIIETHGGHMSALTKNALGNGNHGLIFNIALPAYEPPVCESKDNILFIKNRISNLASIIHVFQNVSVSPRFIESIEDLKNFEDNARHFTILSDPQTIAEIKLKKIESQCYSLVQDSDDILRVIGSPPDKCETLFSEEFVLSRLLAK